MKRFFEEPIVNVLLLKVEDIITTSPNLDDPDEGDNGSGWG